MTIRSCYPLNLPCFDLLKNVKKTKRFRPWCDNKDRLLPTHHEITWAAGDNFWHHLTKFDPDGSILKFLITRYASIEEKKQ
jgi:hypothetical protein